MTDYRTPTTSIPIQKNVTAGEATITSTTWSAEQGQSRQEAIRKAREEAHSAYLNDNQTQKSEKLRLLELETEVSQLRTEVKGLVKLLKG